MRETTSKDFSMSQNNHDTFSLTDFVGGADHHAIKNSEQGLGNDQASGAKQGAAGGGLLSRLGFSALGSGAGFLWRKFGSPVVSKVAAWAEKEFPETSEFLKNIKSRTVGMFKDVASDLKNAPTKIMNGVKVLGEDAKAIKDEVAGKAASVFKSGVSMLSKTKDGVVSAVKHPGALVEDAMHTPAGEAVAKVAESTVGKTVEKVAGGTIAKTVAKLGLKTVLEDIPIAGAAVGTFFAVKRALGGDWTGAAMEETAGIASTFPGVGTAVSTGLNVTLAGRDLMNGDGTTPATPSIPGAANTAAVTPPAGPVPPSHLAITSEPHDLNTALAQVQQQAGGSTGSLAPVTAAAQNAVAVTRSTTTPPTVASLNRLDLPAIPGLTQQLAAHPEISKGVHTPAHGPTHDSGVALTS
jgi:hypothetical protein